MSGLRVGQPAVVKGGAKVAIISAGPDLPASPQPGEAVDEAQLSQAGLFRGRLIEFGETLEETLVSTRPVVREELVVGRTVDRRVERIEETVRRTEAEIEDLSERPDGGSSGREGT